MRTSVVWNVDGTLDGISDGVPVGIVVGSRDVTVRDKVAKIKLPKIVGSGTKSHDVGVFEGTTKGVSVGKINGVTGVDSVGETVGTSVEKYSRHV